MKYLNKIAWSIGALAMFVACADLDTYPESDTVLSTQKDASMVISDINGFNSILNTCSVDTSGNHFDFGYPATCIALDAGAADAVFLGNGNWFGSPAAYTNRLYTSAFGNLPWTTFYKYIANSNNIISSLKGGEPSETGDSYLGFAYAARGWAYLNLVQVYALNYAIIDPSSTLGVPIVTEETSPDAVSNNPRATVEEVYSQIMSDLDLAVELLDGAAPRDNKSFIDLSVAYGIRARANLAMHNYAEAAADARSAQAESSSRVLTLEEVSVPGFNSADVPSVMWVMLVPTTSRAVTTGIVNWPSFLCSFDLSGGYTTAEPGRMINKPLWDVIPDSDVRKGWWVDEDVSSPLSDDIYVDGVPIAKLQNWVPYVNVKFHDYQSVIASDGENASDWILMRREEMILIEAEGLAMSGDLAGGKAVLEGWVKANRDKSYVSSAASAADFQDEVWFQRRIELWSEGFSWFDIMRLNKNIVRQPEPGNTSFLEAQRFNVAAESPVLLWHIPASEINGNDALDTNTNPAVSTPLVGSGAGLTDGVVN